MFLRSMPTIANDRAPGLVHIRFFQAVFFSQLFFKFFFPKIVFPNRFFPNNLQNLFSPKSFVHNRVSNWIFQTFVLNRFSPNSCCKVVSPNHCFPSIFQNLFYPRSFFEIVWPAQKQCPGGAMTRHMWLRHAEATKTKISKCFAKADATKKYVNSACLRKTDLREQL